MEIQAKRYFPARNHSYLQVKWALFPTGTSRHSSWKRKHLRAERFSGSSWRKKCSGYTSSFKPLTIRLVVSHDLGKSKGECSHQARCKLARTDTYISPLLSHVTVGFQCDWPQGTAGPVKSTQPKQHGGQTWSHLFEQLQLGLWKYVLFLPQDVQCAYTFPCTQSGRNIYMQWVKIKTIITLVHSVLVNTDLYQNHVNCINNLWTVAPSTFITPSSQGIWRKARMACNRSCTNEAGC